MFYAAALAVLLAAFGLMFYLVLDRTVRNIADESIEDAAESLIAVFSSERERASGGGMTDDRIRQTLSEFRFQNIVFAVFEKDGAVVALSPRLSPTQADRRRPFNIGADQIRTAEVHSAARSGGFATIAGSPDPEIRVFAAEAVLGGRSLTVAAIRPLTPQLEIISSIRLFLLASIPVALVLASLGGYYLAGQTLKPVADMSEKAARITSTNLGERLPRGAANDELGNLADAFNALLDRLEGAFRQQRRFMADASHELRTPLSVVLGESDVALQREGRSEAEYRESLEVIRSEGARLSRIVEDLFILAKAGAGNFSPRRDSFYLDELVGDCVRSASSLAGERNRIESSVDKELLFTGDEDLLRRMVMNLLDNAVKYSDEGTVIAVTCAVADGAAVIEVSNSGDPVPEKDRERIFDRFYRSAGSRHYAAEPSRGAGAGLGLAIARSVAAVHRGRLVLERSDHDETVFRAELPIDRGDR